MFFVKIVTRSVLELNEKRISRQVFLGACHEVQDKEKEKNTEALKKPALNHC